MSDTFEDVADGLDEFEQAEGDGAEETTDEVVDDELPFLDIDQFKDYRVPVKIDGEDVALTLAEVRAGYQRQADYTRKTQELAQQKAEVQWASAIRGALENDPQGTLELLAEKFGVRFAAQSNADEFSFDDPWSEPADPKYREIETRLARFDEERAQQQLEATIRNLSAKYGDEFDPQEVVMAAMQRGSTDLEGTFKQIRFDKVMEDAKAAKAEASKVAKRTAAKRDAAVVSGGSPAGAAKSDDGSVFSIADAWREAKRSLGA